MATARYESLVASLATDLGVRYQQVEEAWSRAADEINTANMEESADRTLIMDFLRGNEDLPEPEVFEEPPPEEEP
jgi:hypothetical protein